jgi:two-component sensor histidine kinase
MRIDSTATREMMERTLQRLRHRAKNDLQIVSSLLRLQARSETAEARLALWIASARVRTIALAYEALDTTSSEMAIDMQGYLDRIVSMIVADHGGADVRASVRAESLGLAIETAVPCGLLVNELLSWLAANVPGPDLALSLQLASPAEREFVLSVSSPSAPTPGGAPSKIVGLLLEQLGARLTTAEGERGFEHVIRFSVPSEEPE